MEAVMLWELKDEKGWTGWTIHTSSGTTKEEALRVANLQKHALDVRWTCEESHSYFVRGSSPVFKDKNGNTVETTIWEIKAGRVEAEYTGRKYEIECWLCGDKYFTSTDLDPKRSLHPLCVRGEHIWDIPCQACYPGQIHCGRRPGCGTTKLAKDFYEATPA